MSCGRGKPTQTCSSLCQLLAYDSLKSSISFENDTYLTRAKEGKKPRSGGEEDKISAMVAAPRGKRLLAAAAATAILAQQHNDEDVLYLESPRVPGTRETVLTGAPCT